MRPHSLLIAALMTSGCSVTLLKKDRTLEIVQALSKPAPSPTPAPSPSPSTSPEVKK